MSFELPNLPFSYNALEPHFDATTMEIHHSKHHQAYITNLNNAIANTEHASKSILELVKHAASISPAVRNNAGGHYNHSLFWETLSPSTGKVANGHLADAINKEFTNLDGLKEKMNQAGLTRFGSGWVWLIVQNGSLAVCSSPNQDNPLMDIAETKGTPLLGIDVWEHAYYLKYQNRRADYLKAYWNVVNWDIVEQKYNAAL